MKKERNIKGLILALALVLTVSVFGCAFTDYVYAVPDDNPVIPIEPETPQPEPEPQPVPQPEPQPQQPRPPVNNPAPQWNQNTQNDNQTQEENEEKADTRLLSLSIECGDLNPEFSSDVYSYTVYVSADAENRSCITSAEAVDSEGTKIKVKGPKEFKDKDTKKIVIVEAEDGSKSEYVINIHILKDNEFFIGGKLMKLVDSERIGEVLEILSGGSKASSLMKYMIYAAGAISVIAVIFAVITAIGHKKSAKSAAKSGYRKQERKAQNNIISDDKNVMSTYAVVVLLNYIDSVDVKKNFRAPSYFNEELKIGDLKRLVHRLEKKKFIEVDLEGIYTLTSKGDRFLNMHADYIDFFALASEEISITEYQYAADEQPEEPFERIMLKLILEKLSRINLEDDFDMAANMHVTAGKLYQKLDMKGQALYHYICALYIDVSGVRYSDGYVSPHLISDIRKLADVYTDDMLKSVCEENKHCQNLCNEASFGAIVKDIVDGV